MPQCHRFETFHGNTYDVNCSVCSNIDKDVVFLPEGDKITCGCIVDDVHKCNIISLCESHSVKADSRKANPGTEYAFTLTMPPEYISKKPIEESARLLMENGLTSGKPYEKASKWAIVLEHTEKGTPHIHGVYQTPSGRRIEQKYFKRYWDLWDEKIKMGHGHKGGYHQKARHSDSYAAYIEKEGVLIKSN